MNKKDIEELEFEHLLIIDSCIKNGLDKLKDKIKSTLNYIQYITVPLIVSSIEEKAYNPFSGIFEKYVADIIASELKKKGFKAMPLGYSSDTCFESKKIILNIDIKTANFDNPSDFKNTIPMGMNQFTYPGIIPVKVETDEGDKIDISEKGSIRVWPNLPRSYNVGKEEKITLTFGILLLYPPYKDIVDKIRENYIKIRKLINKKLRTELKEKIEKEIAKKITDFDNFMDTKIKNTTKSKGDKLSENIIRGCLIHEQAENYMELMGFSKDEKKMFNNFKEEIKKISIKLKDKSISPISIICISIPSGFLAPNYDGKLVSGKSFAESIRYHYEEGRFENLEEKPRIIFSYLDNAYKNKIIDMFHNVYIINGKEELYSLTKDKKVTDFEN